ncbi:hypothetical protein [Bacillus sp. PS06]|uniref:hypothetical protein n=1 Tax=Bacillus sp. PS06 TaxID=2764176 RepID=UPI00177D0964|nr:hypothetical protein [Bacillus sp. PS06]MBD8069134.1 hypothetical protein [Bacillus sp. PS06]
MRKYIMLLFCVIGMSFIIGCSNNSATPDDPTDETTTDVEEEKQNEKEAETETDIDPIEEEEVTEEETSTETDGVKEDLYAYYHEGIVPLGPLEAEALGIYDSVTGDNYVDDETLYYALVDAVIPIYRKFTNELQQLRPETKEVRDLHRLYIDGAQLQLNGMLKMITALEEQSYDLMGEANNVMYEGYQLIMDFQYELQDLVDEHGIESDMNQL